MGVLYFLHKETSRRRVIFCSSRSCCLSVLCFVAKCGFLYGFCSDLMCHDDDSRSNKHCCQLYANPPSPRPPPLLSLCCTVMSLDWCTEFLAKISFATIVLRILWNSSREFCAIVPRTLRNSTFKSWRLCPILLWQPSSFNWTLMVDSFFLWTAIFCNNWANNFKVLWKVGMQSHFHTSGSEMLSRRRMRRRSRKILNAGGF